MDKKFCGEVVLPASPIYNEARQEWNRSIQKYPAAIVYCCNSGEIADALAYARENCMDVRIRSGGHNYEGFSVGNGALVIDTSLMKNVAVDLEEGWIRVGSGLSNRELYKIAGAFGYPFPSGTCPTVCVAGLTTGGGWGYSGRIFGLTCDSLMEAQMVDACGNIITANEASHPGLFWALRGGGGGNFGVVTSLKYRLPPKLFQVSFVEIRYHKTDDQTAEKFFRAWQDWLAVADERFTPNSRIFNSQEEGMGIFLRGIYYGTPEEAARSLQPFLRIAGAQPVIRAMTFLQAAETIEAMYPPYELFRFAGRFAYGKFSEDEIQNILRLIRNRARGSTFVSIGLYALGGKVKKIAQDETAFFYRDADYIIGIETVWENPEAEPENLAWMRPRFDYLQSVTCGSYINFPYLGTDDYMWAYYGCHAPLLQNIKEIYDPGNLFRFPQSIR